jgi:hypothetical protein
MIPSTRLGAIMVSKAKILEVLGSGPSELLLLEKVRRSLQANERVKYLLTLLQLAKAQAEVPAPNPDDLSVERKRAGIEDPDLDRAIPQCSLKDAGSLEIPAGNRIVAMALQETLRMCDPVLLARKQEGQSLQDRLKTIATHCGRFLNGSGEALAVLLDRTASETEPAREAADVSAGAAGPPYAPKSQQSAWPLETGENAAAGSLVLPVDLIGRLTSADRSREDSLHLVVMDAHKAINALIADLSGRQEKIGGADALGLTAEDRQLLEAFTSGVAGTSRLKGNHPGLSTSAVRMGSRLMIQNDIGETDAHVFLIEIEDGRMDLTYTDVHEKRVQFFMELLSELPIK